MKRLGGPPPAATFQKSTGDSSQLPASKTKRGESATLPTQPNTELRGSTNVEEQTPLGNAMKPPGASPAPRPVATFHKSTEFAWPADFFAEGDATLLPAMGSILRGVKDFCLWGNDKASTLINDSMLMPQLLEATASYDWKVCLQVVCQQMDVTAQVFFLDANCLVTGCETFNTPKETKTPGLREAKAKTSKKARENKANASEKKSKSQTETVFRLLNLGDRVLPLIPRDTSRQKAPYLAVESVGEFSVGLGKYWQESATRGTEMATHEDLACLFFVLLVLDGFNSKKTSEYGLSRWPHDCIDHFTASVATRFPFSINRQTMTQLVHNPMRQTGLHTESSKLKRTSLGCTVIESNPSMLLRICFFINAFQSTPWGPDSSHIVLGGGRRHGALLAWITRCHMTIISVDKSTIAHEEAIRIVNEYRLAATVNPRVVHVLRDTADFTAEELKGVTSTSRFVGSTKSNQLGKIDKIIFESEFMIVYWNCHVSATEFKRLADDFGMCPILAAGWKLVIIGKLRQEKTGMTVYLWLRQLPTNTLVLRSPQLVKWRSAALEKGATVAANETGDTRAVNNLTADLKPDEFAFVRRSSRKPPSKTATLLASPDAVPSPNPNKNMTPRPKNKAKGTPKNASALTPPPAARNRISDKKPLKSVPKGKRAGKPDKRKEVPVASPITTGKGKVTPVDQVTAPTTRLKDTVVPNLHGPALATVPDHSKELSKRLAEQAQRLATMEARALERELQRKAEHSQLLASFSLHTAHSPPVNPPSTAVPDDSLPAVVPVVIMERLDTQAKNIKDVLLEIQKNQTPNPLAMKQMEMIAALDRANDKTKLKKKMKKDAKKKEKRKTLKKNKKSQETKARWNAKRTKTELAVAAKAAQALAAVQQYDRRDDSRPSSRSRLTSFVVIITVTVLK